MTEQPVRHTADTITDDELDQLYARTDYLTGYASTLEAYAAEQRERAEQVEDLLRIVHNTSNTSESERARAVQRAEQAEAERDKACTAFNAKIMELEQAKEERATLALIFEGFDRLLATSSRDWQPYRVDAWLYAVICGWDCEQTVHDSTCAHGALEETAAMHGWDGATIAKARRYRTAVRALTEPKEPTP